jgi:uncharacterized protein
MNYRGAKIFILNKLQAELPKGLSYHGLHHTKDVLRIATSLCAAEGVKGRQVKLIKTAALLHDAGFVKNQHSGHEHQGCIIAQNVLPQFGYTQNDIDQICKMIMSTKIPQSPDNLPECILCDADLDYLGRPDFYKIARSLFEEMLQYRLIGDESTWNRLQVSFLSAHSYHTDTNRRVREPVKRAYLVELENIVKGYNP